MGTVYRKTVTKPIPTDAEILVRSGKRIARWKVRGKTRSASLTANGDRITVAASTYTAKFRDGSGAVCEVATGCKDETAARKVLSDLERRAELVKVGLIKEEEDSAADHLRQPIDQQVTAYLHQLHATASHRKNVKRQLNRIVAGCGFKCLADLDRRKLALWLGEQTGMGARTRNTYLAAAIAFGNWCAHPEVQRLVNNPFARMAKADEQAGKIRKRRAMTEAELVTLLDVARGRPLLEASTVRRGKRKGEPTAKLKDTTVRRLERLGWERALIYKTLVLTGLRKSELASLTVGQLELDGGTPHAQLNPADEKNGEGNKIPLRSDLADDLRRWVAGMPFDAKVFTVPDKLVKILNRDLKAAGIEKKDERGRTLDVHALRHSFSTLLSKGGVAPRTAQAAMRHSKLELTMTTYTDPKLLDIQGALEVLPLLPITVGPQPVLVQTDTEEFAPLFAPNSEKGSEAGLIADKMGEIDNPSVNCEISAERSIKGTPQTTCDVPPLMGDTGLEPVTPSLSSAKSGSPRCRCKVFTSNALQTGFAA